MIHGCHVFLTHCSTGTSVVLIAAMFVGCTPRDTPRAFDNEGLRLLSVSRKFSLFVGEPGKQQIWEVSDKQEDDFNRLITALSPIESVKMGKLPSNEVDYVLLFQPGKNPVTIKVHLEKDRLVYAERQYLYKGGDAKVFRKVLDTIVAHAHSKQGAIRGADDAL
jgi:hypothetical protein